MKRSGFYPLARRERVAPESLESRVVTSDLSDDSNAGRGRLHAEIASIAAGAAIGLVGTAFRQAAASGYRRFSALLDTAAIAGVPGWLLGAAIGGTLVATAVFVTRRFAPEAAGSGIQEIEGTLAGTLPLLRWRQALPVKFLGGLLSLSSGMLLGREGPTIHMGGSIGAALAERGRASKERMRLFVGAGAAAGLATAFGAPIAGILFALEELRREFPPTRTAVRCVALASVAAVLVGMLLAGTGRVLAVPSAAAPSMLETALVVPFAVLVGAFGVLFNKGILASANGHRALTRRLGWIGPAFAAGAGIGALVYAFHDATGGGEDLTTQLLAAPPAMRFLALLLVARFALFQVSYASGVPGGIFAPQLAFGAILGLLFTGAAAGLSPGFGLGHTNWALAGMAALIAATVRTPLTGVALVVEMTGSYQVLLMALVAAITAEATAKVLGGRPIYEEILERELSARNGN